MITMKVSPLPDPDFDETILLRNMGKAFLKSQTKMRWPLALVGGALKLACVATEMMVAMLPERLQQAAEKSERAWLRWKKARS
jgi:hypothetical protein